MSKNTTFRRSLKPPFKCISEPYKDSQIAALKQQADIARVHFKYLHIIWRNNTKTGIISLCRINKPIKK